MIGIFLAGVSYKATCMTDMAFIQTMFEMLGNDIVFIDTYKTDKSIKQFGIPYDSVLHYECKDVVGWKEHFKYAKDFLISNNIDTLIIFKPLMMQKMKYNDMYQYNLFKRKRKENNQYGFKYETMKHVYARSILIEVASKVCKRCIHFIVDPQEPNFNSVYDFNEYREAYFLQKHNNRECVFMPCCEYGLNNIAKDYVARDKVLDFCFYCGALTEDRQFIKDAKDVLKTIPNSDVEILESGKDFIKQEHYYGIIAQSKFTLCIKPYDKTTFSALRWFEALCLDCIPLIHKGCCIDDFKGTYPDIYKVCCKYNLFVDFNEIQEKIFYLTSNDFYDIILKEIRNTKSFRKINDLSYIRERWKKLLCI